MLKMRLVISMFLVGLAAVLSEGMASAQNYPNKSIHIVVSQVGSGPDITGRLIGQYVAAGPLGQPVIIDNRPANIVPPFTAKAAPDGYTMAISGTALWITPLVQKVSWDAIRDFSQITELTSAPTVILVSSSLPVKSLKELIDLAKNKPGVLNYGSGAVGGGTQLAVELFKSMAGVNIARIPYPDSPQAMLGLMKNEVQMMIPNASEAGPHLKTGDFRALAVNSAKPTPLLPGIPTAAEAGLPGFEVTQVDVLFAPAKTPEAIIQRVNQEVVRVLKSPDVVDKFFNMGVDVVGNSPQEATAKIKSETAMWAKVIKSVGLAVE